jgi:hypothetical protein
MVLQLVFVWTLSRKLEVFPQFWPLVYMTQYFLDLSLLSANLYLS